MLCSLHGVVRNFLDGGVGVETQVFLVELEWLPGSVTLASEGFAATLVNAGSGTVVRLHDELAGAKDLARVLGLLGRQRSGGRHLDGSELALWGHDNSCGGGGSGGCIGGW